MKPLTTNETKQALDDMVILYRSDLARARWITQLHRDCLKSEEAVTSQSETDEAQNLAALHHLEKQRGNDAVSSITRNEDLAALTWLIERHRTELARLLLQVQIHRDVMNAPAERVLAIETSIEKTAIAISWFESNYEKIKHVSPPSAQIQRVSPTTA